MWLIKYYDLYYINNAHSNYFINYYDNANDYYKHSIISCYHHANFKKRINECNFEERLKYCNRTDYMKPKSNSISDLEILFDIKWIELVVFFFLLPTLCFIGIATNILSILTLKQQLNLKKEKDKRMSEHILANSIFNIIYCIITLLRLINICIFNMSIFCSSLYMNRSSQYFNIIIINFIGNIIKLCCNVSFISFSLSRFTLSTNSENRILKKLDRLSLKLYYSLILAICTFLSIFKLLQYQINDIFNSLKSYPFEKYDVGECFFNFLYCYLFRCLNLINQFIRDILFFVVNLIIDLCLLKNSIKNFRNKIKVTNDKSKLNDAIRSKKKITRLFLTNGLIYTIGYSPEFLTRILIMIFEKNINDFCNMFISCNDLNYIAECFTFISISFQFLIYKNFNKNFNEKFGILKKRTMKFISKS